MFIKLEPENYIKTRNILSDSENPNTPWYNGMVLAKEDCHPTQTTIIAYSTEPDDDDEVFKFRDYLNDITPPIPYLPMPGMYIDPYYIVFGLNTISRRSKLIGVKREE